MKATDLGWVVISPEGKIFEFTFKRTRSDSIKHWNSLWSKPNWRKNKREGYSCVKAKQTTEIL